MEINKSNRGGARAGSGRKKTNNVNLCLRMPKDVVDYIRAKSKEENIPIGAWIMEKLCLQ